MYIRMHMYTYAFMHACMFAHAHAYTIIHKLMQGKIKHMLMTFIFGRAASADVVKYWKMRNEFIQQDVKVREYAYI